MILEQTLNPLKIKDCSSFKFKYSVLINLIYDYVDKEKRIGALALKSTFAGVAVFFTTLAVSLLVSCIQNNSNTFLDLNVYAQQVCSIIATILIEILIVYLNVVVVRIRPIKSKQYQKEKSNAIYIFDFIRIYERVVKCVRKNI